MSKKSYIIPIFVPHMGCHHACVFCNQKEITGQLSQPSGQDVSNKIKEYLATIPDASHIEVAFYGGSFTAISKEKQIELLTPAFQSLNKGQIQDIRLSTRPDYIDENILSLLMSYGVSVIELGVQSTDTEVLQLSKRGHSKEDIEKSSSMIKSWGFVLGLQMMVGLPGDSPDKSIQTAKDIINLKPGFVRIYPALVVKNTELADMYQRGEYFPLTLGKTVDICKDLLLLFDAAKIKVIRIGLQPTEEISEEGEVIAGPFHPAFRELVESAVAKDQLVYILEKIKGPHTDIILGINPADTSIVRGQKNTNIAYLKQSHGVEKVNVVPKDYIERGTIVLLDNEDSIVCKRTDLLS